MADFNGWYSIRCNVGPNIETNNRSEIDLWSKHRDCFVYKFKPWTDCHIECSFLSLDNGDYVKCCNNYYFKKNNPELWKVMDKKQ